MKKNKSHQSVDNEKLDTLTEQELLSLLDSAPFATPALSEKVKRKIQQRLKHTINRSESKKSD